MKTCPLTTISSFTNCVCVYIYIYIYMTWHWITYKGWYAIKPNQSSEKCVEGNTNIRIPQVKTTSYLSKTDKYYMSNLSLIWTFVFKLMIYMHHSSKNNLFDRTFHLWCYWYLFLCNKCSGSYYNIKLCSSSSSLEEWGLAKWISVFISFSFFLFSLSLSLSYLYICVCVCEDLWVIY